MSEPVDTIHVIAIVDKEKSFERSLPIMDIRTVRTNLVGAPINNSTTMMVSNGSSQGGIDNEGPSDGQHPNDIRMHIEKNTQRRSNAIGAMASRNVNRNRGFLVL